MRCSAGLAVLVAALAACSTAPAAETAALADQVLPPAAEAPDCTPPAAYGGYLFWIQPPSVATGASVRLTPWFTTQPGVMEPVPAGCLVIDEVVGAATLAQDSNMVTISADAAGGSDVVVRGRVGDALISGRIIVYRPAAMPLVGYWAQRPEDCGTAEPMRELHFTGDGKFSATWRPFEVYKDYWGTYSYSTETGELVLTPEGGNHVPPDARLTGKVGLSGDVLEAGEGLFGSPAGSAGCAAPFHR